MYLPAQYTDAVLLFAYKQGLQTEVLERMASNPDHTGWDLNDWMKNTRLIASGLSFARSGQNHYNPQYGSRTQPRYQPLPPGDAMDIDRRYTGKETRRCHKCGQIGHLQANCKGKQQTKKYPNKKWTNKKFVKRREMDAENSESDDNEDQEEKDF